VIAITARADRTVKHRCEFEGLATSRCDPIEFAQVGPYVRMFAQSCVIDGKEP
jgi:hypothetical protein